MRIRSIRPEFWTSSAISSLTLEDRLLFIGIWSYVDDNGVGPDRLSLIATELFPDDIEREPRDTFARVSRGLANLSAAGRITRYTVDGKDYLSVTNWTEHQRIDRPGKSRYPHLTTPNAVIRETLATVSRDPIEDSPTGEGEKGRRGEGEKNPPCPPDAAETRRDWLPVIEGEIVNLPATPDRFAEWWDTYDKKVSRKQAEQKWRLALKKPGITAELLIQSAAAYIRHQKETGKHPQFTKNPETWLNGEHWNDELVNLAPNRGSGPRVAASMTEADWNQIMADARAKDEADARRTA